MLRLGRVGRRPPATGERRVGRAGPSVRGLERSQGYNGLASLNSLLTGLIDEA